MAFGYQSSLCFYIKVYIMLGVLMFSLAGYGLVEYLQRKEQDRVKSGWSLIVPKLDTSCEIRWNVTILPITLFLIRFIVKHFNRNRLFYCFSSSFVEQNYLRTEIDKILALLQKFRKIQPFSANDIIPSIQFLHYLRVVLFFKTQKS